MNLRKIGIREWIIILLSAGIMIAAFFAWYASTQTPPLPDDITQRITKNNAVKPPALPSDVPLSPKFQENVNKATKAAASQNYFQAVFHYRKALTFLPKDTTTRRGLIEMLKKSCEEDGNDMHCLSVEEEAERLIILKETGKLKYKVK